MTWTKEDANLGEREPLTLQEQRLEDLKRLCLLHSTNVKKFDKFFRVCNSLDLLALEVDLDDFLELFNLLETTELQISTNINRATKAVTHWTAYITVYGTTIFVDIYKHQVDNMLENSRYTKEELQKLFPGWKQT